MRRTLATVLGAVLVTGCGGGGGNATTDTGADVLEARALDYAYSARRALEGTRFQSLGDEWLGGLVLEVCRGLPGAADPEALVAAALGAVEAPAGAPGDDAILVEVMGAGLAEVCPETVLAAGTTGAADASGAFVAAALPEIEAAGLGSRIGPIEVTAAGSALCTVLDTGGSPEEAVLAEIVVLFGVTGESMAALSESGALDESESRVAGAILAAAAAFLCPDHRPSIQEYLADLEE
jgi:hypothetical protein